VILSESEKGLQTSLNLLHSYCIKWHLTVNIENTKVIIFSKRGNVKDCRAFCYGNDVIESVKCYTYLGIIFTSNGTFTNAVNCLKDKALKAMHNLLSYTYEMQPKLALHMFNVMIKPIVNYGSEIWITNFIEKIHLQSKLDVYEKPSTERISLKFAKHVLGVQAKTSNAAVRGELGLFPSLIEQSKLAIRYWKHVLDLPKECIAYKSLMECNEMHQLKIQNWLTGVLNIFETTGISPASIVQPFVGRQIENKLQEIYSNNWLNHINADNNGRGNKLRTYCLIKQTFEVERYLGTISDRTLRTEMTKFRTSAHKLSIETGRYTKPKKTPVTDRICTMCKSHDIEDEHHFIFDCSLYNHLRHQLNLSIQQIIPSFPNLTRDQQFTIIMSGLGGDYEISMVVANYIHESFKLRYQVIP
jgi:hypothetical protein